MKEQLLNDNFENYKNSIAESSMKQSCIQGMGNLYAKIVLIGEAPGANEIKQGKPFVGSAGKNLDMYLNQLEIERENIYITNVIKYRPIKKSLKTERPINRTPTIDEIKNAAPYLIKELQIINPKLLITLGNISLKALTQNYRQTISEVHGKLIELSNGFSLFPLYHPASIIYNNSLKTIYQNDVAALKQILITEGWYYA